MPLPKFFKVVYLDEHSEVFDETEYPTSKEAIDAAKDIIESEEAVAVVVYRMHNASSTDCVIKRLGDRDVLSAFTPDENED